MEWIIDIIDRYANVSLINISVFFTIMFIWLDVNVYLAWYTDQIDSVVHKPIFQVFLHSFPCKHLHIQLILLVKLFLCIGLYSASVSCCCSFRCWRIVPAWRIATCSTEMKAKMSLHVFGLWENTHTSGADCDTMTLFIVPCDLRSNQLYRRWHCNVDSVKGPLWFNTQK